jgi:hypothetical protein
MNAQIISPTQAKVTFTNDQEKEIVTKFLAYKNTSLEFQIIKHRS